MPADLQSIADPRLIVLVWAAGLSALAGVIALSRIVGIEFIWLCGGVAAALMVPGALTADGWPARLAFAMALVAILVARSWSGSGYLLIGAALLVTFQAVPQSGLFPTLTAIAALGGVTGEMMLGHWYLIDPRLPRSTLRLLAALGMIGLVADGLMLTSAGLPGGGPTIAFWVLLATSFLLMAAVIGSLKYPAYSGVMAATGLSYLAVLTTLGAVFLGRALVAGLGPFTA